MNDWSGQGEPLRERPQSDRTDDYGRSSSCRVLRVDRNNRPTAEKRANDPGCVKTIGLLL